MNESAGRDLRCRRGWKQVLMTAALCSDLAQVEEDAMEWDEASLEPEDVAVKMGR